MSCFLRALPRGALLFAIAAAAAGCGDDGPQGGAFAAASRTAPDGLMLSDSLAPAVVVAKRPSVSEILDMVLRERPVESDEAHVASVLREHTSDDNRADRIAAALVKEGRRRKVGSSLLVGVLLTENPWLDPRATSFVGARGLMQVMPFHAGKWNCGSRDLFDIESNICHGVAVLAENLGKSKTLPQALLGYNGCVRGTNTPDCWRYPGKVFKQARKSVDTEDGVRAFSGNPGKRVVSPKG